MNSESVGRQVSSMLDSEFLIDWVEAGNNSKPKIRENVENFRKSRDCMKKLRLHEKVEIS